MIVKVKNFGSGRVEKVHKAVIEPRGKGGGCLEALEAGRPKSYIIWLNTGNSYVDLCVSIEEIKELRDAFSEILEADEELEVKETAILKK